MKRAAYTGVLLFAGCWPTSAELMKGGHWSARARAACFADPALRGPAIACSSAVQVMASEGAGRADVADAEQACVLPQSTIVVAAGSMGSLLDAAGQLAAALAEKLRERDVIRQAVLLQATEDLAAEQARAAP